MRMFPISLFSILLLLFVVFVHAGIEQHDAANRSSASITTSAPYYSLLTETLAGNNENTTTPLQKESEVSRKDTRLAIYMDYVRGLIRAHFASRGLLPLAQPLTCLDVDPGRLFVTDALSPERSCNNGDIKDKMEFDDTRKRREAVESRCVDDSFERSKNTSESEMDEEKREILVSICDLCPQFAFMEKLRGVMLDRGN